MRKGDKLAPIRDFWDRWESNLCKLYNPGACTAIDELLVSYRGRCPFKQYIPSKTGKYDIKIWARCDAATIYAWSLHVYTGRDRNCKPEKNQDCRVVLDLVKDPKGWNITCDNFFTSHELGIEQKIYNRRYCAQKQNIPSDKDQGFERKARAFFAIFI